jgi:hypothetical protein
MNHFRVNSVWRKPFCASPLRAIVKAPAILADEPTSALDENGRPS